jgi:hypothetical protein
MVHCRMYHAAAKTAQQQANWKAALDNIATTQADKLFVPAQIGTFNATYKWGPNWQFGVNAEFRFLAAEQTAADDQWNQALALMQNAGPGVLDALAERWDEDLEHPDADQSRVNYQRVDL